MKPSKSLFVTVSFVACAVLCISGCSAPTAPPSNDRNDWQVEVLTTHDYADGISLIGSCIMPADQPIFGLPIPLPGLITSCGFEISYGKSYDTVIYSSPLHYDRYPANGRAEFVGRVSGLRDMTTFTTRAFAVIDTIKSWSPRTSFVTSNDLSGWLFAGRAPAHFGITPVAVAGTLCFGYNNPDSVQSKTSLFLYNEQSGIGSTLFFAFQQFYATSLQLHGKAYFFGDEFAVFDPRTNSISYLHVDDSVDIQPGAFFTDGNSLFSARYQDSVLWKYDIARAKWTKMKSSPFKGRDILMAVSDSGAGFVLTQTLPDANNSRKNECWRYDPVSDTWSLWPVIPQAVQYAATGSLLYYIATNQQSGRQEARQVSLMDGSTVKICDIPMLAPTDTPVLVADGNWLYLTNTTYPDTLAPNFWKHRIH